jgi:hypothetical protein
MEPIYVECCRTCKNRYDFLLSDQTTVTVLCGRPENVVYKAVSYVWEMKPLVWLPLKCRYCDIVTFIPMRTPEKLLRMLTFLGGKYPVWLDAMSINQTDEDDKKAQLVVMGDIYRKAEIVSVFLPSEDEEAYMKLKKLAIIANNIVTRREEFQLVKTSAGKQHMDSLQEFATKYLGLIEDWGRSIERWRYWKRAWTFQEWAMAAELEMTFESAPDSLYMTNFKNIVVMASSIVAQWEMCLSRGEPIGWKQVDMREKTGTYLNLVRAYFPFQDFLISDSEYNADDLRKMSILPPMPSSIDSGTYVQVGEASKSPSLRSKLSLALNSIHSSQREAGYAADLIACWASMCDIEYDYDIDDSEAAALHKVVRVLRTQGIRIYNFLANTMGGETDLNFLEYAAAHRHSNSRRNGFLFGSPIFIGRADTVTHIQNSLEQTGEFLSLPPHSDVIFTKLDTTVIIKRPVCWANKDKVLTAFRGLVSGKADGELITDVMISIEKFLDSTSQKQLENHLLVQVSIGVKDQYTMWYFNTWGIIPSGVIHGDLIVGRESLNGTLVLALLTGPKPSEEVQILSYLTMTHQRDGTWLVKCDKNGVVDVVFRTVDTPQQELFFTEESLVDESMIAQVHMMDSLADRAMNVEILIGTKTYRMASEKTLPSL